MLSVLCAAGGAQEEAAEQGAVAPKALSSSNARVRFVHGVPGAPSVTARIDKKRVFGNVRYGSGGTYRSQRAGLLESDITTVDGRTNITPPINVLFSSGTDYTLLYTGSVSGTPPLEELVVETPRFTVPNGQSQLWVIHGVADADPIDVLVDGNPVIAGLPYKDSDGGYVFSPGNHTIEVQVAGSTVLGPVTVRMQSGRTHTFVVLGTADPSDGFPLIGKTLTSR